MLKFNRFKIIKLINLTMINKHLNKENLTRKFEYWMD